MRMIQNRAVLTVKRHDGVWRVECDGEQFGHAREKEEAKATAHRRPPAPPGGRFRAEIEGALAEGLAPDDLILRLTLRDVQQLTRDPAVALADISFAGGVMRFLGVRVEKGGVLSSTLDRGGCDPQAAPG